MSYAGRSGMWNSAELWAPQFRNIWGRISWWTLLRPKLCLSKRPAAPNLSRQMLFPLPSMNSAMRTPLGPLGRGCLPGSCWCKVAWDSLILGPKHDCINVETAVIVRPVDERTVCHKLQELKEPRNWFEIQSTKVAQNSKRSIWSSGGLAKAATAGAAVSTKLRDLNLRPFISAIIMVQKSGAPLKSNGYPWLVIIFTIEMTSKMALDWGHTQSWTNSIGAAHDLTMLPQRGQLLRTVLEPADDRHSGCVWLLDVHLWCCYYLKYLEYLRLTVLLNPCYYLKYLATT